MVRVLANARFEIIKRIRASARDDGRVRGELRADEADEWAVTLKCR
jgi:hypothetical protein